MRKRKLYGLSGLLLLASQLILPFIPEGSGVAHADPPTRIYINFETSSPSYSSIALDPSASANSTKDISFDVSGYGSGNPVSATLNINGLSRPATIVAGKLTASSVSGAKTDVFGRAETDPGHRMYRLPNGLGWEHNALTTQSAIRFYPSAAADPSNFVNGVTTYPGLIPLGGERVSDGKPFAYRDDPGGTELRYKYNYPVGEQAQDYSKEGWAITYSISSPKPTEYRISDAAVVSGTGASFGSDRVVSDSPALYGTESHNIKSPDAIGYYWDSAAGINTIRVMRLLNGALINTQHYQILVDSEGTNYGQDRNYFMSVKTKWTAYTYLYEGYADITYETPLKPDLAVVDLSIAGSCFEGGSTQAIKYSFKNNGVSTASTFQIKLSLDGVEKYSEMISGASNGVLLGGSYNYTFSDTGPKDFTFTVNSNNAIDEGGLTSNNTVSKTFQAKASCTDGGGGTGGGDSKLTGILTVDQSFIPWKSNNMFEIQITNSDSSSCQPAKLRFLLKDSAGTDYETPYLEPMSIRGKPGTLDIFTWLGNKYQGNMVSGTVTVRGVVVDTCGDFLQLGPKTFIIGNPPPNQPPEIKIAWFNSTMSTPIKDAIVGDVVGVKITSLTDPEGDPITQNWQFTGFSGSSTWVASLPAAKGLSAPYTSMSYSGFVTTKAGSHKICATASDNKGGSATACEYLDTVGPEPIPVINGGTLVKVGRTLVPPLDSNSSYTPVPGRTIDHTKDAWVNKQDKYFVPGSYDVFLDVFDNTGLKSLESAKYPITVIPDQPPVASLLYNATLTRLGTSYMRNNSYSPDGDTIVKYEVTYGYDRNNNGSCNVYETLVSTTDGSFPFNPSRVGNYCFRVYVEEEYGLNNTRTYSVNVDNEAPVADFTATGEVNEPTPINTVPVTPADFVSSAWKSTTLQFADAAKRWLIDTSDNSIISDSLFRPDYTGKISHLGLNSGAFSKTTISVSDPTDKFNPTAYEVLGGGYIALKSYDGTKTNFISPTGAVVKRTTPANICGKNFENDLIAVKLTSTKSSTTDNISLFKLSDYRIGINTLVKSYTWPKPSNTDGACPYTNQSFYPEYSGLLTSLHSVKDYATVGANRGNSFFGEVVIKIDPIMATCDPDDPYSGQCKVGESRYIARYDIDGSLVWRIPEANLGTYGVLGSDYTAKAIYSEDGVNVFIQGLLIDLASGYVYPRGPNMYYFNDSACQGTSDSGDCIPGHQEISYTSPNGWKTIIYSCDYCGDWNSNGGYTTYSTTDPTGNYIITGTSPIVFNRYNGQVMPNSSFGRNIPTRIPDFNEANTATTYQSSSDWAKVANIGVNYLDNASLGVPGNFVCSPISFLPDAERSYICKPTTDWGASVSVMIVTAKSDPADVYPVKNEANYAGQLINYNTAPIADIDLSFTMKFNKMSYLGESDLMPAGMGFRIVNNQNMYRVETTPEKTYLFRIVNGVRTKIGEAYYPVFPGVFSKFNILTNGTNIKVKIEGTTLINVDDATFSSGRYGPFSLRSYAEIKNVFHKLSGSQIMSATPGTSVVNTMVKYDVTYADPEQDPILSPGTQWKYIHTDPGMFLDAGDGLSGLSSLNGAIITNPNLVFDKVGLYRIEYRVPDDPQPEHRISNGDGTFASYSKYSTWYAQNLIVHRRPFSVFTAVLNGIGKIDWTDSSYDPDRCSATLVCQPAYVGNKGIYREKYYFVKPSGEIVQGKLGSPQESGVYIVGKAVMDEYGAWSDFTEHTIDVPEGPKAPPNNPPVAVLTFPDGSFGSPTPVSMTPTIRWNQNDPDPGTTYTMFDLRILDVYGNCVECINNRPMNTINNVWAWTVEAILQLGAQYSVQVRVWDGESPSEWSNIGWMITNRPPSAVMVVPGGTQAAPTVFGTTRPTFEWNQSDPDPGTTFTYFEMSVMYENGTPVIPTVSRWQGTTANHNSWLVDQDLPAGVLMQVCVKVSDGYAWSPCSVSTWFKINRPPSAVMTYPTGTVVDPTIVQNIFRPTFAWNQTDPDVPTVYSDYQIQVANSAGSVIYDSGRIVQNTSSNSNTHVPNVDLPAGEHLQVRVTVWDQYYANGTSSWTWFYIDRPPIAAFSWTPPVVYEGDSIQLIDGSSDPDSNAITWLWTIQAPNGSVTTSTLQQPPVIHPALVGNTTVTLKVTDFYGMTDEVTHIIQVLPLTITGFVRHIPRWDFLRQEFNLSKGPNPEMPWRREQFLAGEPFLLHADTTIIDPASSDIAQTVVVTWNRNADPFLLIPNIAHNSWDCEMWNENYKKLTSGAAVFTFTVTFSNGTIKTAVVPVDILDNTVDEFWVLKRDK